MEEKKSLPTFLSQAKPKSRHHSDAAHLPFFKKQLFFNIFFYHEWSLVNDWSHTEGDFSAAILLPSPDISVTSSPAAIASIDAAMPALSFFEQEKKREKTLKFCY